MEVPIPHLFAKIGAQQIELEAKDEQIAALRQTGQALHARVQELGEERELEEIVAEHAGKVREVALANGHAPDAP